MRISFLVVLAIALLVGLGFVVAIKSLGLFTPPVPQTLVQPTISSPPPPVFVLVPLRPIYAGDPLVPGSFGARVLLPDEVEDYNKNKKAYIPGSPSFALYRFVKRDIPGNQPLKFDDLEDVRKPTPIHDRLLPGSRAVNVEVSRNHSSGGLIQRGDWVDVYITTDVSRSDDSTHSRRTGLVVGRARVIAKRDSLVDLYSAMPEKVTFTLGMNPYRAALLENARTLGVLSLEPVSKEERNRLDKLAAEVGDDPTKAELITIGDPTSREAQEEKARVERMSVNGMAISTSDLAKALHLDPLEGPIVQRAPQVHDIEVMSGLKSTTYKFPLMGLDVRPVVRGPAPEYVFSNPEDAKQQSVPVVKSSPMRPALAAPATSSRAPR